MRKVRPLSSPETRPGLSRAARAFICRLATVLLAFFGFGITAQPALGEQSRIRCIVETDAGGDPDDEQSFVRFLLYANEWDIEAIIASRPVAREGENKNPERTGLGIIRRLVEAYGQCYTNLVQHDPRYPPPEHLLERTVPGYGSDAGVELLIKAVDGNDPRPVWFCNWGTDNGSAPSCLKRALDRILRERGTGGYAAFKQKLRLASADKFAEHTTNTPPAFVLWVDTFRPDLQGQRWYHRFSALTAKAGGFDVERDVRTGHGPLGALYPTNTTHWLKEGDTMTFLYLVPNGLNAPEQPGWGGWGGRYGKQESFPGKPYYWANQLDAWEGTTHRDNTVKRWAIALQNDFKTRLDWCVRPAGKANHPPRPFGNENFETQRVLTSPGTVRRLSAGGTSDPDSDTLSYEWFIYPEAGTYPGALALQTNGASASLRIPADAGGTTIHLVFAVTDSGEPPLTRYRRIVFDVQDRDRAERILAPLFNAPVEFAGTDSQYRSPLLFADGSPVRTRQDWKKRREEIRSQWQQILGPWPPLLQDPKLEVLSSTPRENFIQHRV